MDLTPREIQLFEDAFELLDADHEGSVTAKELGIFLRNLGKDPTEQELLAMINEVDTNGTGCIEFEEFLSAMTVRMCNEPEEDDLREAFRIFDKDNTGYIGFDHLRTVMLDLNMKPLDEEIEDMIRDGDLDGDGYLSYEEFAQMMSSR